MASALQETTKAVAQLAIAVGSVGGVVSKTMLSVDRLADALLSQADTFVAGVSLRNNGNFQDIVLEEEEKDFVRMQKRAKLQKKMLELGLSPPAPQVPATNP